MRVLKDEEERLERKKYIDVFIDKLQDGYAENIMTLRQYSDGYCYKGYLWDYFKKAIVVTERFCLDWIEDNAMGCIKVLWDIHSKDNIFIENYWKYPKHSILCLCKSELRTIIGSLPEDIYIYDDTYRWTIALTHEQINEKHRFCLLESIATEG